MAKTKDTVAPLFGGGAVPTQLAAPLPEDVTVDWDTAHTAGYWGVKMDPVANEDYTVAGVIPDPPPLPDGDTQARRGPGRPPSTRD
jgi:hypothetical protein